MHQTIPMEAQVAITLLKLAISTNLQYIIDLFGVGKATLGEARLEVCDTLQDMLGHTLLQVANSLEVVVGFRAIDFLQCIGALDGIYLSITCPPCMDHPYYSQQGFHSIMLQAVVDHWVAFTNICSGWTGSANNTQIFQNSALPALIESSHFVPGILDLQLSNKTILPLLIGDPSYLLLPWPYSSQLNPQQAQFN
ncbi:hypothetical protein Y1Q_0012515 [Alligator mississippiensis]|uniref:DDE Tnp4 domain-containing protein n=1 Tax=Alligator mississippiensis TaxID=8496 RepID=A0A151M7Y6_ALLMI|nr:hypothetical protein Y1Q_0012515 [Alligator mississippiensis]